LIELLCGQCASVSVWLEYAIAFNDDQLVIKLQLGRELEFEVAILLKWNVTVEEYLDGIVLLNSANILSFCVAEGDDVWCVCQLTQLSHGCDQLQIITCCINQESLRVQRRELEAILPVHVDWVFEIGHL
jgi:hypothetical protein